MKYDAIIIGTGQAGPSLATRLAQSGKKVAIIEKGQFGGTCVNNGCIPTKTLVASARVAYMARRSAEYGVNICGEVTVDMKAVKARKDGVVAKSNQGVENWLRSTANLTVYQGHARFLSHRTVRVGGDQLEADQLFINVGASPVNPELPGLSDIEYLTNENIMDVDYVPEHLVIIGGSYIGLEFSQMYRRFGSRVTLIDMSPRLIPREDEDVSHTVKEILENEDIDIQLNAEEINFLKSGDEIIVKFTQDGVSAEVKGSHVLLATGRRPNTEDLGLAEAGIETNAQGYITVDEQLRTNIPGIWALGDCNGQGAFTHTSYNDYEIVAENLLGNEEAPRSVDDRIMAYGLYIDPPLGRVGMTELQAKQSGRNVLIGKRQMAQIGRAVEKGETQGFMKVLVDADSKEILGAAILGVTGDEVVHSILDIMYAKAPYTVVQRAMHIHPTVSELIPTMLGELEPLDNS